MGALEGRVAAVTGAGAGIGRACALAFAEAGAAVVLNDLDAAGLEETVGLVRAAGGRAEGCLGDAASREDLVALVARAEAAFGGLDAIVANAAVSEYVPFEALSEADLDRVLGVNLRGALLAAQVAIPALRLRGGGSVVFVSSVQAFVTLPGCTVYGAAKAGLVAAARALAVELGPAGIRVNAVAPGTIETPMLRRDLSGMNVEEAAEFRARVASANALGRIGSPDEIARTVVYLCSPAASYVTGTTLVADGGFLAVKRF